MAGSIATCAGPLMKALYELADRWEAEAETLERYHDERGAATARLHATELREAVRAQVDELLSPPEAEKASGFSRRRLRELEADGRLENHGRKGAPRYRRSDLPTKSRADDGFDAAAEASRLITS